MTLLYGSPKGSSIAVYHLGHFHSVTKTKHHNYEKKMALFCIIIWMALLAMSLVVCVRTSTSSGWHHSRLLWNRIFVPLILSLLLYSRCLDVAKYPETYFVDTKSVTGRTIIHILELWQRVFWWGVVCVIMGLCCTDLSVISYIMRVHGNCGI